VILSDRTILVRAVIDPKRRVAESAIRTPSDTVVLVEGMSEAELAVMRGPDRDAHGANVPQLLVQDGKVEVSFEKSSGGLYSQETPTGPGGKAS